MTYYHGKVVGPNGQVYQCEHNHRTYTAAVTCANSSATRQMAAMVWNRAAVQAAQAAARAKKREEERAAAEAQRIAAREASAARRAAAQAAAEETKAAKRAAKLAAMSPRRAWKRMTPEERLLKTAQVELEAFGEIKSPDAKVAYEVRAERRAPSNAPAPSELAVPRAAAPPPAQAPSEVPAYLRALDPSLTPQERTLAKGVAASDPEQWQKYLTALRAQQRAQQEAQVEREIAELKAGMRARNGVPARGMHAAESAVPSAPAPGGKPTARASGGLGGDGLYVVGLDIRPGVYRTAGPTAGRDGYFALLKSTNTHDIVNNGSVRGPATITVGTGVKAVEVRHCQRWQRLGDTLDAVVAAINVPKSQPVQPDRSVKARSSQSEILDGRRGSVPISAAPSGAPAMEASRDSPPVCSSSIGGKFRHKGIEITLLDATWSLTVNLDGSRAGQYEVLNDDGAKFVSISTRVLNDSQGSIDLTCSRPINTHLIDERNRKFDCIRDLYRIPGNPECNYRLNPGFSSNMKWIYRVPIGTSIVAFEFEDWTDFSKIGDLEPTRVLVIPRAAGNETS
jgi:hypothetical protein